MSPITTQAAIQPSVIKGIGIDIAITAASAGQSDTIIRPHDG
jgi:hypothetical protein